MLGSTQSEAAVNFFRSGRVILWARKNLFSTIGNSLASVILLFGISVGLYHFVEWAIINATISGDSREACSYDGACWTFIKVHFSQLIYGFYPADQTWRIDLFFGLIVVGLIPFFLGPSKYRTPLMFGGVSLVSVFSFFLLSGGTVGLPHVETSRWGGLFLTLVIALTGILVSLPIGIVLALGRRSQLPVIKTLSVFFIELWRGVPLITVLFMSSVMLPLFLPTNWTFDKLLRALVGVSLFSSAYMAEVIRGGLQSIPSGQYEAADALGLNYFDKMYLIILPQALRSVIPGIVNTFIGLFKDTTLVLIIGLFDLLGMVQTSLTNPQWLGFSVEGYLFAGFGFWIFCFFMSQMSMKLERRLAAGSH